jgi:hypothetical protein
MQGISFPAENRLASQEGLCSIELINTQIIAACDVEGSQEFTITLQKNY